MPYVGQFVAMIGRLSGNGIGTAGVFLVNESDLHSLDQEAMYAFVIISLAANTFYIVDVSVMFPSTATRSALNRI
jgi:hypothetical protein